MDEVEPVQPVRILTLEFCEPFRSLRPQLDVSLYDSLQGGRFTSYRAITHTMARLAQEGEGALWAYVSTGLVGLASYCASKPDVWRENQLRQ
jgi:hypothetical protein